ncbi:MAG: chemotaxis protein [Burkholderiales bacterium]
MSELLKNIDARSKLAGTNKLEMLLFTLGQDQRSGRTETFGINVFKIREVMRVPVIARAPDMPPSVEGMVSLRGALVPVVDLIKFAHIQTDAKPEIMIVTEYNGIVQGFLVNQVDTIRRMDWSAVRVPPAMINAETGGFVTAVTELEDGRLVMMMDVEKILSQTSHCYDDERLYVSLKPLGVPDRTVFFADDSSVARKQIERTLDGLGVKHISAQNGRHAWTKLENIASQAAARGVPVNQIIQLVLTDIEMPEMDGYMLTKNIKADKRFAGVPVVMHSSLSGTANQMLGKMVGVDHYVSKFEPEKLAEILQQLLSHTTLH